MRALFLSLLALSTAAAAATAASAQRLMEVGIDVGAAAPSGSVGEHRGPGAHVALSLGLGTGKPLTWTGWRAEVTWTRLQGDPARAGESGSQWGDFTSRSARVSMIPTLPLRGTPVRVYGVLGLGAYDLAITDRDNPYGILAGTNFGFGVSAPVGRVRMAAELQGVAVISDYGAEEFEFPVYWPLTIGIRL